MFALNGFLCQREINFQSDPYRKIPNEIEYEFVWNARNECLWFVECFVYFLVDKLWCEIVAITVLWVVRPSVTTYQSMLHVMNVTLLILFGFELLRFWGWVRGCQPLKKFTLGDMQCWVIWYVVLCDLVKLTIPLEGPC